MINFEKNRMNRRGQLTIFVIVAIVIVVGIAAFFVIRGNLGVSGIPVELEPVYDYYDSCIENELKRGLDIAGSQGGRIEVGEYAPGSEYAPFSNQLNFLGFPVPYWYYVSGNGVIKEQVPSKSEISGELGDFLAESLGDCDFSLFEEQGFDVFNENDRDVNVRISGDEVRVGVSGDLIVSKEDDRGVREEHEVSVDSQFGRFYDIAREIYEKQKEDAFLEDYGIDVLRNYAPVDGTEIQCEPKIWKTREVESDLKDGLEANIGKLKIEGDYYDLNDEEDRYFVIEGLDLGRGENVQFMYSESWPTKLEIEGDGVDSELIIAEAVGNQEGLGIMGFCYVPYHYVYDLSFPVLVQLYNNEEVFQFPVSVIIDNNVPREVEFSEDYVLTEEEFDLCEFKTQEVEVRLFDVNLNPVNGGRVSYECFDQKCNIGVVENEILQAGFPQCVNGFIHVRAEGYTDKKESFSSNVETFADIVLDREHEVSVELNLDGKEVKERAIVLFSRKDGGTVSAVLPEVSGVKLSEGEYEIKVYAYTGSEITIPGSTKTECRDIPESGILGFFGAKDEECFDISIPETKIENALIGGGTGEEFLLESQLEKGKLIVEGSALPRPKSIEELQNNFAAFGASRINVRFENA